MANSLDDLINSADYTTEVKHEKEEKPQKATSKKGGPSRRSEHVKTITSGKGANKETTYIPLSEIQSRDKEIADNTSMTMTDRMAKYDAQGLNPYINGRRMLPTGLPFDALDGFFTTESRPTVNGVPSYGYNVSMRPAGVRTNGEPVAELRPYPSIAPQEIGYRFINEPVQINPDGPTKFTYGNRLFDNGKVIPNNIMLSQEDLGSMFGNQDLMDSYIKAKIDPATGDFIYKDDAATLPEFELIKPKKYEYKASISPAEQYAIAKQEEKWQQGKAEDAIKKKEQEPLPNEFIEKQEEYQAAYDKYQRDKALREKAETLRQEANDPQYIEPFSERADINHLIDKPFNGTPERYVLPSSVKQSEIADSDKALPLPNRNTETTIPLRSRVFGASSPNGSLVERQAFNQDENAKDVRFRKASDAYMAKKAGGKEYVTGYDKNGNPIIKSGPWNQEVDENGNILYQAPTKTTKGKFGLLNNTDEAKVEGMVPQITDEPLDTYGFAKAQERKRNQKLKSPMEFIHEDAKEENRELLDVSNGKFIKEALVTDPARQRYNGYKMNLEDEVPVSFKKEKGVSEVVNPFANENGIGKDEVYYSLPEYDTYKTLSKKEMQEIKSAQNKKVEDFKKELREANANGEKNIIPKNTEMLRQLYPKKYKEIYTPEKYLTPVKYNEDGSIDYGNLKEGKNAEEANLERLKKSTKELYNKSIPIAEDKPMKRGANGKRKESTIKFESEEDKQKYKEAAKQRKEAAELREWQYSPENDVFVNKKDGKYATGETLKFLQDNKDKVSRLGVTARGVDQDKQKTAQIKKNAEEYRKIISRDPMTGLTKEETAEPTTKLQMAKKLKSELDVMEDYYSRKKDMSTYQKLVDYGRLLYANNIPVDSNGKPTVPEWFEKVKQEYSVDELKKAEKEYLKSGKNESKSNKSSSKTKDITPTDYIIMDEKENQKILDSLLGAVKDQKGRTNPKTITKTAWGAIIPLAIDALLNSKVGEAASKAAANSSYKNAADSDYVKRRMENDVEGIDYEDLIKFINANRRYLDPSDPRDGR